MTRQYTKLPVLSEQDRNRFWASVQIGAPDECWLWMRRRQPEGYGRFRVTVAPTIRHKHGANRVAYMLYYGEDPFGFEVCHRCDNPPCCNPTHLFKGTTKDNADDRERKGRTSRGEKHSQIIKARVPRGDDAWSHQHPELVARGLRNGKHTKPECTPRGERHGNAVLTEILVKLFRKRHLEEGTAIRQLAREYPQFSRPTIRRAIYRKTWKHVD